MKVNSQSQNHGKTDNKLEMFLNEESSIRENGEELRDKIILL